ncbi:6211_t:CDS:2 [Diversispora eburnea]|uniref:6211_t:CDS:1 n=1 Tax=Diversispora eburnea TaxID=1213867 RepID=A0A9N8YNK3_9GLOM|nr:6211_t:CDS:2 [Diversispora eburnea]
MMPRYFFRLRPTTNLLILNHVKSNHLHPKYSFFHQTKKCQFSILTLLKTLTNPLTLLLENLDKPKKTIQEIKVQALETYEKFNCPSTHTFNKTPNFVGREKEKIVIEEILNNSFKWIVVSGVERVGKTALLREILSDDKYNVIHFDLRIPGFANLHSFVTEFSYRIETFLLRLSENQQFDKESAKVLEDQAIGIKPKLLEKFHASLLKYHSLKKDKIHKQIPVIFIDEAHKLRNLIKDDEALQILFDMMVVFATQDKLCQVIHSTSDDFYDRFLTKTSHIKFLVIGDLNYSNISHIFYKDLLPSVPKEFRENLVRMEDDLYEIFGGNIVDWQNFVQDYKISCGNLTIDNFEPLYRVKNQFVTLFLGNEISIKLISLFQRIVSNPLHCIGYHYACNEFTQYIIDKLIEEGILKYRLTDEIGEIVHNEVNEVESPYVMPSSMMTLHVMKMMIQEKQDKQDKKEN